MKHTCTVFLKDEGQDFLEFDIRDGVISDTRPFQGWVWNGKEVVNARPLKAGDHIYFDNARFLLYPIERVEELI